MKSVLITGASRGLGKEIAELMSNDEQYAVSVPTRKEWDIENARSIIGISALIQPDIIIHFAGRNHDGMLHKVDPFIQKDTVDTNCFGAFSLANTFLPAMRQRGYGRIIMISSVLATRNVLGTGVYSASKAFIDKLVENISAENIGKGITANSLQLGYFDAGMTHRIPDYEKLKENIGLKRFGRIDELYQAIEFLINTEYVTGTQIKMDGGLI